MKHLHNSGSFFSVYSPESLLGAMQDHAQVILTYLKPAADFGAVSFFEEAHAKDVPVLGGQFRQDVGDLEAAVAVEERRVEVDGIVGRLMLGIVDGVKARLAAKKLPQDVIGDGVDKGAEALGLFDGAAADRVENAEQRFLEDIFNEFRRPDADAQFQPQEAPEIGAKVIFHQGVAAGQLLQIAVVERMEVQKASVLRKASL